MILSSALIKKIVLLLVKKAVIVVVGGAVINFLAAHVSVAIVGGGPIIWVAIPLLVVDSHVPSEGQQRDFRKRAQRAVGLIQADEQV